MIMDRFICKYCGKEVVLENDVDVDIRGYNLEYSCVECYNKYELAEIEYEEYLEDMYWNDVENSSKTYNHI